MRPLLQHASRSIRCNVSFLTAGQPISRSIYSFLQTVSRPSSICLQCQFRASSQLAPKGNRRRPFSLNPPKTTHQRTISSKPDAQNTPESSISSDKTRPESQASEPTPPKQESPITSQNSIKRVPDEDLPSHREGQRWDLSKRLSELMDELLPKLAVVTQKVNTYTGTDYSGIEALRREIKEQGRSGVKAIHRPGLVLL